MDCELRRTSKNPRKPCQNNRIETIPLYPGIELSYLTFVTVPFSIPNKSMEHMAVIHYCKAGQLIWKKMDGGIHALTPGSFSLHTGKPCMEVVPALPSGPYEGLMLFIELQEMSDPFWKLPAESGFSPKLLSEKLCRGDTFLSFSGNMETGSIFSGFYDQPECLRLPYQKLKVWELLLYLSKVEIVSVRGKADFPPEQLEIIRKIHEYLTLHMEKRITIEELSRQYLINPTTLKAAFKSVYGTSIAAHIKEHRMEHAAKLLRESDLSAAEIAKAVGYESQSRFTAAFKAYFGILPKEYRKRPVHMGSKIHDVP